MNATNALETNRADREALILEHMPQVRLIARKIYDRLPGTVNLEDLVSSGIVGLISAIDRYDATQGVKLKTYAEYKIRGAILDSLRELDWAPRRQRRRARQLQQAVSAAEQKTQRAPSEEEVAKELGISVEECREWMADSHTLSIGSLDYATRDEEGRDMLRSVPDGEDSLPSHTLEQGELQKLLARALDRMPATERTVVSLYYHEELTLREIAKVMQLHESRISQLKIQALNRLRSLFEKQWPNKGSEIKLAGALRSASV